VDVVDNGAGSAAKRSALDADVPAQVHLTVGCRDLPADELSGKCCPIVGLFKRSAIESASTAFEWTAQTELVEDSTNPNYGTKFTLDFNRAENLELKFNVYNVQSGQVVDDDRLGSAVISLNDIVDSAEFSSTFGLTHESVSKRSRLATAVIAVSAVLTPATSASSAATGAVSATSSTTEAKEGVWEDDETVKEGDEATAVVVASTAAAAAAERKEAPTAFLTLNCLNLPVMPKVPAWNSVLVVSKKSAGALNLFEEVLRTDAVLGHSPRFSRVPIWSSSVEQEDDSQMLKLSLVHMDSKRQKVIGQLFCKLGDLMRMHSREVEFCLANPLRKDLHQKLEQTTVTVLCELAADSGAAAAAGSAVDSASSSSSSSSSSLGGGGDGDNGDDDVGNDKAGAASI
jgi:hypothetical protein